MIWLVKYKFKNWTEHESTSDLIGQPVTDDQKIERAKKILDLYAANPTDPIIYEGKLIELPMIKKLQKLI